MAKVRQFTFNPFQENTYVIADDTKECVIIDPGMYDGQEKEELVRVINENGWKPVRLLNTHCHLDHIFGNRFVAETYKLPLEIPEGELPVLKAAPNSAMLYGIPFPEPSPEPGRFIEEGEIIEFGNTKLQVLYTPGHSPASMSFYCEADQFLIAGDVLFYGSIGRTDLPGGNHDTLISSIKDTLFLLGDGVKVYSGHGPSTSIGYEKKNNPFLS